MVPKEIGSNPENLDMLLYLQKGSLQILLHYDYINVIKDYTKDLALRKLYWISQVDHKSHRQCPYNRVVRGSIVTDTLGEKVSWPRR